MISNPRLLFRLEEALDALEPLDREVLSLRHFVVVDRRVLAVALSGDSRSRGCFLFFPVDGGPRRAIESLYGTADVGSAITSI